MIHKSLRPAAIVLLVVGSGCGSSTPQTRLVAGERLLPVDQVTVNRGELKQQCRAAARRVGYALPCPQLLPRYATSNFTGWFGVAEHSAVLSVSWETNRRPGHFVIAARPRRLGPLRAITYPARPYLRWDRVEPDGHGLVLGQPATWVKVGPKAGDIFRGHFVLVWSEGGHTYVLGFHGTDQGARALDQAVAESLTMVSP